MKTVFLSLGLLLASSSVAWASDYGPPAQVRTLRSSEIRYFRVHYKQKATITDVRVCGNLGIMDWNAGESGGQTVYKRTGTAWKRLISGGGMLNRDYLRQSGASKACAKVMLPGE